MTFVLSDWEKRGNGIRADLKWAPWEDGCWHAYQQWVRAGTDMGHNNTAEMYRYAVLKHCTPWWGSWDDEPCPLRNPVTAGDPPSGWKQLCSPLLHNTPSVSAQFAFISTHSLHHPVLSQCVFLFLSLTLYFRSGLFYSLTHTPHRLTVITMTLSIKYIMLPSLSLCVDLRTSLLYLSLSLSCLRLDSDVAVQAALWEVASVCHKIWITLFYTVLAFRRTPLHPLGLNVIDFKEHLFKNTRSLMSHTRLSVHNHNFCIYAITGMEITCEPWEN